MTPDERREKNRLRNERRAHGVLPRKSASKLVNARRWPNARPCSTAPNPSPGSSPATSPGARRFARSWRGSLVPPGRMIAS